MDNSSSGNNGSRSSSLSSSRSNPYSADSIHTSSANNSDSDEAKSENKFSNGLQLNGLSKEPNHGQYGGNEVPEELGDNFIEESVHSKFAGR
jgi:hypothetical protein